jgi:hypothetical protein
MRKPGEYFGKGERFSGIFFRASSSTLACPGFLEALRKPESITTSDARTYRDYLAGMSDPSESNIHNRCIIIAHRTPYNRANKNK